MRLREALRNSSKGLLTNRLRTFLTMLGVIIGVFSVVMLTSIGEGVKRQVSSQVESLGANLLYILPGKINLKMTKDVSKLGVSAARFGPSGTAAGSLTYDDVLALKGRPGLALVTGGLTSVDRLDELRLAVTTTGVDEDYNRIRKRELRFGRFIDRREREARAAVAVLGQQANRELFAGKNSLGKVFHLNGKPYRVIGVLKYYKVESLGPGGEDWNVKIFLPLTEMLPRVPDPHLQQIVVQAPSAARVNAAESVINQTMRRRHKPEEYSVIKQQDMLNTINNILGILTAALGGIAAISLVVGGIGIMNIMLVSVTERTREIGVRKAIGAKYRDILFQFLIESTVLSLLGGLLGLGLGIAAARLLPLLVPEISTAVSIPAALLALVFALLVGIFFGVYPASKAARLDPIEALRSE